MKPGLVFLHLFAALAGLVIISAFVDGAESWPIVGLLLVLSALIAAVLARQWSRQTGIEQRFRIYFERAVVGMAISGLDKKWQVVNPALCNILGYPAEELVGKTWDELTYPADLAANKALFERVVRGEIDDYELQKRYVRADGQVITAQISVQAVRKADGSVDTMLVVIEDITAQLAAEKALRDSEERLRHLGDNLPDSYIYQCTQDAAGRTRFLYVSSGVRVIHGCEPEALLEDSRLLLDCVDPAQLPALQAAEAVSRRDLSDLAMELRVRLADGEWGWLLLRSRPRRLAGGEIIWDGVASNITARRQATAMLDLQTRRAAVLLELPRQSNELGEREFMEDALRRIEEMTGSSIAFMHFINDDQQSIEMIAWSVSTVEHFCAATYADHYPLAEAGLWAEAARQKKPVIINDYRTAENRHGLPPGHAELVRMAGIPVLEEGRVRMLTGIGNKSEPYAAVDVESVQLISNEVWRIVRQRRAEQALRVATQVVNASPVVCFRWRATPGWPVIFVSDNVTQWGYAVADLLAGKPPFGAMVHPDDQERIAAEVVRQTSDGRAAFMQEYRLLTADCKILWVVARTNVLRNAAGEPEFYDGVLTDITERKRQEDELAGNLAAQRILNKRLEEAHNQLLQSEKMASIGQLAAGIAHELNNPIGFVHSNLGTLESYLRDLMDIIDAYDRAATAVGGPLPALAAIEHLKEDRDFAFVRQDIVQLMGESKDGLSRVRKIVQDLKSFSHVSEQEWQWADLHQGLDSTLNIVWNELKYKCTVVKEYGDLPKVHCMISQLNQVFMNLLVNASHAIDKQGTITLRTARRGENEVCIEIADTGKGIAPEHLSRIFEPFFTTKPVGKGTGLGLSLSYGIVDRHHGRIEVDSEVGIGTTFRVILPIQPETGEITGKYTEMSA
ncbi:MAG: PAS domain S-box protein [Bacteroidota bacterium]